MLDYVKTVLTNVSFDRKLFEKELRKAIRMLAPQEVVVLRDWCYARFSQHRPILQTCFYQPSLA
jgi:hypothetical protein